VHGTCHKYSSCEWPLLKRFSRSEVRGQGHFDRNNWSTTAEAYIATRLACCCFFCILHRCIIECKAISHYLLCLLRFVTYSPGVTPRSVTSAATWRLTVDECRIDNIVHLPYVLYHHSRIRRDNKLVLRVSVCSNALTFESIDLESLFLACGRIFRIFLLVKFVY